MRPGLSSQSQSAKQRGFGVPSLLSNSQLCPDTHPLTAKQLVAQQTADTVTAHRTAPSRS